MSYMSAITTAISGLDRWQCAALATVCAESVSPVIARFARPATRSAFRQGLDIAWKSVRDRMIDLRVESVRAALNDLPESSVDDSNLPAYEAMIALSILAYSLDSIVDDTARSTSDACTGARDFFASCDVVLLPVGTPPIVVDPRNPPPPGPLESVQIHSQFQSIEIMCRVAPLQVEGVDEMRASARAVAEKLDSILQTFAERRGWLADLQ